MDTKKGFLLIADISGFTDFIKIHDMRSKPIIGKSIAAFWAGHAEQLIKDLIETIITVFEPVMILNKIEGDAAFFYLEEENSKEQASQIIDCMQLAQKKFREKLSALQYVQACPCDPCQQSKDLRLKIVVHRGEFKISQIREFIELAGQDVIFVHRLLKNSIRSDEYWLFSENFKNLLEPEFVSSLELHKEKVESFGLQKLSVLIFNSEAVSSRGSKVLSKFPNLLKMLWYYK
tara:strand:+ start:340 stop:1038 length:699 start_codon:yes stop_codon:yes gene_type:complete